MSQTNFRSKQKRMAVEFAEFCYMYTLVFLSFLPSVEGQTEVER